MHQHLLDELNLALLDVCRASLDKHDGEYFYCVALYTSGEYGYLVDSISTIEGLEQVAKRYLEDEDYQNDWGTLDVAMRELKWSPCDSPYHCEFDGSFDRVSEILDSIWEAVDHDSDDEYMDTCKEIHETCTAALVKLRDSGLFNKDQVVFNLLMGDQSNEERLLNAEAVNSETVVGWLRKELDVDETALQDLRANRWNW
jgi:hypothetical protein